jgi:bacteriochlorophyll C12 methyltransferase
LKQLAAEKKNRKKWLLVQPKSSTSMMVDSGSVSMPLNLIMVATLAGELFDVTLLDERIGDRIPDDLSQYDVVAITSRPLPTIPAGRRFHGTQKSR